MATSAKVGVVLEYFNGDAFWRGAPAAHGAIAAVAPVATGAGLTIHRVRGRIGHRRRWDDCTFVTIAVGLRLVGRWNLGCLAHQVKDTVTHLLSFRSSNCNCKAKQVFRTEVLGLLFTLLIETYATVW